MALRTPLSVTPHLYMGDSTGRPLDNGVVYFGEQDKDPEFYPIDLFSDDELTKPLMQPVHTKGGYLYDKGDMVEPHAKEFIYSVKVLDSYGRKVFYKGAMMRNSWNDDVIQQINEAVIGSADAARQVAIDITNDAINNTAVEGGILADTFVTATANGVGSVARTQRDKNSDTVSVKDFGAKGDGIFDDRPAFQAAIDYLHSRGGGELYIPKPPVGYRWKSYDTTESACLVVRKPLRSVYVDPISLRGETLLTDIKVDLGVGVTIDAAIKLKGGGLYKKFENLSVWGGINSTTPNCTRVLDGFDTWYPNLTIRDCQFYVAVEDCVRLATYVSVFDKPQTAYSKKGIRIQSPGGIDAPCTALTFNSPYGLNHTHNAIWLGQTTYSTINSPAADHIINTTDDGYEAYPYYIDIARGVTFNGMGAESSTRILYVKAAQGLTINGIMTLSIGNAATPPEALIRIDGGASTVISGIWNQGAKGFNNILKLGKVFSTESVTILDQSIAPSQVSYESNFRFDNPVRFLLWDTSRKDVVINLPATGTDAEKSEALISNLRSIRDYTSLDNTVTVNFPAGDYPLISAFNIPHVNLKGSGKIVFNGHSTGSRIVLKTAGAINFQAPTKLPIIFKNIEIYAENTVPNNIKPLGIVADCDITFDNTKVTAENTLRDVVISAGKINLINGSYIALKNYSSHDALYTTQKLDAAPTLGKYPIGYRVYASNPDATRVGWVNTVRDGANWVTF